MPNKLVDIASSEQNEDQDDEVETTEDDISESLFDELYQVKKVMLTTIKEEGDSHSCEIMTHAYWIILLIFLFMMYILAHHRVIVLAQYGLSFIYTKHLSP